MRNKTKLIELAYETSILYAKDLPGEPFHSDYTKNHDIFRRLIKSDRRTQTGFTKYFKELSKRVVEDGIFWTAYNVRVQKAAEIDDYIKVDWTDEALNMKVILTDSLIDAIVAGGMLMEEDSKIDIGWNEKAPSVSEFIDKYGLKLSKTLNETTKDKVRAALNLSIKNFEDAEQAAQRIADIIDDPQRAATIARTESVAAFGQGRKAVAEEIGWGYKEWHTTIAPCAICQPLPKFGRIPIDEAFGDFDREPAHPNCRCSVRYFRDQK